MVHAVRLNATLKQQNSAQFLEISILPYNTETVLSGAALSMILLYILLVSEILQNYIDSIDKMLDHNRFVIYLT